MTRHFALPSMAAALLVSTASFAYADLTAEDVWANTQAYFDGSGYTVTGTTARDGDALVVSGIKMEFADVPDAGEINVTMGDLTFRELGDGTVSLEFAETYPFEFAVKDLEGADVVGKMVLMSQGHKTVASGNPDDVLYTTSSDSAQLELKDVTLNGEAIPAEIGRAFIKMTALKGTLQIAGGDQLTMVQDFAADLLSYDVAFTDPESDSDVALKGQMEELTGKARSSLVPGVDMSNLSAAIAQGMAGGGSFAFTKGQTSMNSTTEGEAFSLESTSDGGTLKVEMGKDGLVYDIAQKNPNISFKMPDVPFPVALSMAENRFKVAMPVGKSDEAKDFALAIRLSDVVVPELLWAMLDPSQALPHDPASLTVDLSGKAKMLVDFFDPASQEELENLTSPPGELEQLSVNELLLSIAGAKLTGNGAFDFDASKPGAIPGGLPAANGALDLKLVGGNTLLDKLIQMGLVSEQDAMGARMMMGMLAVPGEGEDTLKSKLEINDQGHILANGQRLQ